jgi:hypothetical protein
MKDKSVYQELKEKTASSLELLLKNIHFKSLELLLKNIKIHKFFLEAMQTTGVITEQESKAYYNGLVERIIDLLKEHK